MKALFVSLLFPVLLKTCDGQPDQIGRPPETVPSRTTSGGTNSGGDDATPGTTDVPIDGGLGVLLLAGAAYGVKRYTGAKEKNKK